MACSAWCASCPLVPAPSVPFLVSSGGRRVVHLAVAVWVADAEVVVDVGVVDARWWSTRCPGGGRRVVVDLAASWLSTRGGVDAGVVEVVVEVACRSAWWCRRCGARRGLVVVAVVDVACGSTWRGGQHGMAGVDVA